MSTPTKDEVREQYSKDLPRYERLMGNLRQALLGFLGEISVDVFEVESRIKSFESFWEKIQRKGYTSPLDQIEDLCGLRVICYYPADLPSITKKIRDEFVIQEASDKGDLLEPDRFGYRSLHFIVTLKPDWLNAPNYRGLEMLKAEIQVRTVLMHAWAAVEHKLAYKKKEHIPSSLRRRLYQLSALFEIADEQLDAVRQARESYVEGLQLEAVRGDTLAREELENVDELGAFLASVFPDREESPEDVADLFDEMKSVSATLSDVVDAYALVGGYIDDIERDIFSGKEDLHLTQTGIVRILLDLTNDVYWKRRSVSVSSEIREPLDKWRTMLGIK